MCWLPGSNKKKGVFPIPINFGWLRIPNRQQYLCALQKMRRWFSLPNEIFRFCCRHTSVGFIYVAAQNEARIYNCVFFYCCYRMKADFSWKDCNRAKSSIKYSSCEGIDLAWFDYCETVRKSVAAGTNIHMLTLLLISLFLDLFLEWVVYPPSSCVLV